MLEQPKTDIPHRGKVMPLGQSAGKSFAYLLGVFLGDGCVTRTDRGKPIFRLNTIDEEFALSTKRALSDLTDRAIYIGKIDKKNPNHSPQWGLYCRAPDVCAVLVNDTKAKSVIPDYVFSWSDENKRAFVVGLMDSEGFVAANSNPTNRRFYMGYKSCDLWVNDLVRVMQSIGLAIGKVSVCPPQKEGYKVPTRFHIKMQSWVTLGLRFNIVRKQTRVDRWAADAAYTQRKWPRKRKLTPETTRQAALCG